MTPNDKMGIYASSSGLDIDRWVHYFMNTLQLSNLSEHKIVLYAWSCSYIVLC